MSALTSLTDEHRLILALLGALQTYATRLRSGATVAVGDLVRFAEVFRDLVDYRHHEKEEGILLPFLARQGFEWSGGLLAELRHEHGHLRYLIDVLCQSATRAGMAAEDDSSAPSTDIASARDGALSSAGASARAGAFSIDGTPSFDREQRRQIYEAAAAFVEFKRRHIEKEESALVPAIAARLSGSALQRLRAELDQFDTVAGRNTSSRIYRQAAELVQRYSIDSGTVDLAALDWTTAPSSERIAREITDREFAAPERAARDVAARDVAAREPATRELAAVDAPPRGRLDHAVAALTSFARSRFGRSR